MPTALDALCRNWRLFVSIWMFDVPVIQLVVTVISLLVFLVIVGWAWSKSNTARFEEEAKLILKDD